MDKLTYRQRAVIGSTTHLQVLEILPDGDALVADLGTAISDSFPGHFGPYILTKNGLIQDIHYHYSNFHGLNLPYFGYE